MHTFPIHIIEEPFYLVKNFSPSFNQLSHTSLIQNNEISYILSLNQLLQASFIQNNKTLDDIMKVEIMSNSVIQDLYH